MANQNVLPKPLFSGTMLKHVAIGALIGFVLITIFFFGDGGELEFGFRVYFPTITTTLGGAAGGIFYSLTGHRMRESKYKWALLIFCAIIFIITIFFSMVAGFAVTGDWD